MSLFPSFVRSPTVLYTIDVTIPFMFYGIEVYGPCELDHVSSSLPSEGTVPT